MNFTANAKDLADAARIASLSVKRWNAVPVLGMLKVEVGENIRITGTDLDTWITATADRLDGEGNFSFMVGAKMLRTVASLGDTVEWSMTKDKLATKSEVQCGGITVRLQHHIEAPDFPEFAVKGEWTDTVDFAASELRDILKFVAPCISSEETQYYLNGVYLHGEGVKARATATDGHRMAILDLAHDWTGEGVIIPRRLWKALSGIVRAGDNRTFQMRVDASRPAIQITADGLTINAKCIDGTFPDYRRVLPKVDGEPAFTGSLSKHAIQSMRRLHGTSDIDRAVKLDPQAGLASLGNERFEDGQVSVPFSGTGDKPVGFNVNYLAEALRHDDSITIKMDATDAPALILGKRADLTRVIMPKRV